MAKRDVAAGILPSCTRATLLVFTHVSDTKALNTTTHNVTHDEREKNGEPYQTDSVYEIR